MPRYILLLVIIAFTFSCSERKSPNVILILTDDQGWGDFGFVGNPDVKTPYIDQLAENGTHLTNFYVSAVCSPTRAEILTGRYAVRGGVYSTSAGGERLDLDETTIAEVFKSNGYSTAAYGKWHNGMQYPYHPNARGFDDFYGFCSGHWGNYFSPMLERNGQITKGDGYLPDDLTNKGIEFINENRDKPFFLYLPFNTPHSPMQVEEDAWKKWRDLELSSENDFRHKENIIHTRAAYAMIENIDQNVGRIVKHLDENNLLESTIILFLTDNGPNGWRWNGNLKGIKGSVDEGGLKTPLLIQWTGVIEANKQISQLASGLDILPTLVEMANLQYEFTKELDGISLYPFLIGRKENQERTIINYWREKTSVRNNRFRLSHDGELFDIQNDPKQYIDVSDTYPKEFENMMKEKEKWRANVLNELPKKDQRLFPVGHRDFRYTQLPARDASFSGSIERSNRWPNCSFLTNWISTEDSIFWEIDVLESGDFEVDIYYTIKSDNVGSVIQLSGGLNSKVEKSIDQPHDPDLFGDEYDRVPRGESLVKDFKKEFMGRITLVKGQQQLVLKTAELIENRSIDFRLLDLKRIDN